MEGNAAAIGMANEMHLGIASIDERDRARRLVGECEGVFKCPRTAALAAVMLWREHLVAAAESLSQVAPLSAACAGASGQFTRAPASSTY